MLCIKVSAQPYFSTVVIYGRKMFTRLANVLLACELAKMREKGMREIDGERRKMGE